MTKRPIQIIILTLMQLFNPLANVILNKVYFHLGFLQVCKFAWTTQAWDSRFTFFFLGPLTAYAIFSVKRWSLPLTIGCVTYVIYQNIANYLTHRGASLLAMVMVVNLCQATIIVYLLLPRVRTIYVDAKVRWWESLPRYVVALPCSISMNQQTVTTKMTNISEGGVFLISAGPLEPNTEMRFHAEWISSSASIPARVVYSVAIGKERGFGIEFLHDSNSKKMIRAEISQLRKMKTPTRIEPRQVWKEIRHLLADLAKGGGWLPPVSANAKSQKKSEVSTRAA